MRWRTNLSVPLFSAALTITVPAAAQNDAALTDINDRATQRSTDQQAPQRDQASQTQQPAADPRDQFSKVDPDKQHEDLQRRPEFKQVSELLKMGVRGAEGETIGHISDIVVDPATKQVKYVVLTAGQTLGVGGTNHAVPWAAFSRGADDETLVLNVSQEQVSQMEGFDSDAWPDAGNFAFGGKDPASAAAGGERSQAQAGQSSLEGERTTAARAGASSGEQEADNDEQAVRLSQQNLRDQALEQDTVITPLDRAHLWSHRASELIGLTIQDAQGEDLGSIEDLIVESSHGRLAYAIVAYGGTLGIGDNHAIVPWGAMQLNKHEQVASLDADRQTLDQLTFEGDTLPDMNDQRWVNRTHGAFGQEPDAEVFGYSIQVEDQPRNRQNADPSRQDQSQPHNQSQPRNQNQGDMQGQDRNQSDRSQAPGSDRAASPSARDAERGGQTPAREPSTPSTGDMQGQ